MSTGLQALDGVALGGAVLCGLVAWRRGRQVELVALAGSLAVYVGGTWVAPLLAPVVPVGTPAGPVNLAAALVTVFAAGLLGAWLLARLGPLLVRRGPATGAERALAAVFGLLRAWVLGLMAATVVALTPAAQSAPWQASTLASWLTAGVRGVQPLLSPGVVRHLAR